MSPIAHGGEGSRVSGDKADKSVHVPRGMRRSSPEARGDTTWRLICIASIVGTALVSCENVINTFVLSSSWFCFLSLSSQVKPGPRRSESRRREMGLGGGLASVLLSCPREKGGSTHTGHWGQGSKSCLTGLRRGDPVLWQSCLTHSLPARGFWGPGVPSSPPPSAECRETGTLVHKSHGHQGSTRWGRV